MNDPSDILRDIGKKIRMDSNEIVASLSMIESIFTKHEPVCPTLLSWKRTCLFLVQLVQVLDLDSAFLIQKVGILLGVHLGRLDGKFLRFFLCESLDVVRILRDLVGGGSVEVYQGFRALLAGPDETRGIVISVGESSKARTNLLNIVLGINEKLGFFYLADQQSKLDSIRVTENVFAEPKEIGDEHVGGEDICNMLKTSFDNQMVKIKKSATLDLLIANITTEDHEHGFLSLLQTSVGEDPRRVNIGRKLGKVIWSKNIFELKKISNLDEIFISNLGYPILLILCEKLRGESGTIKFIMDEIVSDFTLSEFVEAAFSTMVVSLISELDRFALDSLIVGRQLVDLAEQLVGGRLGTIKKSRKATLTDSMMTSNFLEIIENIQEMKNFNLLRIFIEIAGKDVIEKYANKTLETIIYFFRNLNVSEKKAISIFLNFLKGGPNFHSSLPGLIAFMDDDERSYWLEDKSVPEGLKLLWKSKFCEKVELYCIEILNNSIYSKTVKFQILTKLSEDPPTKTSGLLINSILKYSKTHSGEEDLRLCANLLGRFGNFVSLNEEIVSTSLEKPFVTELITEFLVPNLRSTAHAYALQEILSVVGTPSVSPETLLVINPYFTSSYRRQPSSETDFVVSDTLTLYRWIVLRIQDEKFRIMFSALELAANENRSLVVWLVPFAVESVFKVGANETFTTELGTHLSALLSLNDREIAGMVFGILDKIGFSKLNVAVNLLVSAAILIEDWTRALFWQEQAPVDAARLCQIYKGLEDAMGVAGVLTLSNDESLVVEKFESRGKFADWIKYSEKDGNRLNALLKAGEYLSVVDAVRSSGIASKEPYWEASWKGGFKELNSPELGSYDLSFNEAMFRYLCCDEREVDSSKLILQLMHQVATNHTYSGIAKLYLLTQVSLGNSPSGSASLGCRSEVLRGAIGIAKCRGDSSLSDSLTIELVRHYRRLGDLPKLRQLVVGEQRTDLEWLKAMWCLNDREEARILLEKNTSLESKLLLIRWSTELERLIPRITISKYRELIKESDTTTLKEKSHFHFADYLDSTITSSGVWNMQVLAREIAFNLMESIKFDSNGKRTLYTVNRLLQLHFEYSRSDPILAGEVLRVLSLNWKLVPVWVWAQALSQLIPRLSGESPEYGALIEQIVSTVLCTYPRQSGWSLIQLITSRNVERKKIGTRLFNSVAAKAEYPNMGQFLSLIKTVGESLVAVARQDGDSMKNMSESKEGSRLLRDTGGLLVMPIRNQLSITNQSEIRIGKFLDPIHVYNTKAKPKRISVLDTDGKSFGFILKVEKKTDLRKDARMMDFVSVVNKEIQNRLIPLRTYSVIPLSEDSALIEFIPNLITLRKVIDESLAKTGKNVNMYLNKEVMTKLNKEGFEYFVSIVDKVPPMIAEWMVKQFPLPAHWLRARMNFTASQAMWSMVGHIVGLGDRHPDNILIDQATGEIVHVDFDCIFSRGMVLTIPELVPFRLTKICVSAMGITGVEGHFRINCESLMRLLRKKKKTLLTVLHAFIADPLIDWNSPKKAKEVVDAIEKKLNGFVDVGEMRLANSENEKLILYNENGDNAHKGLGKDRGAPLSVEGQVDELIRAAVCQRNLSKMYLGWMPLF